LHLSVNEEGYFRTSDVLLSTSDGLAGPKIKYF
jgi:hypothetical protein